MTSKIVAVVVLAIAIIIVIVAVIYFSQAKQGQEQDYQVTKEYYTSQGCKPLQVENGKVVDWHCPVERMPMSVWLKIHHPGYYVIK